eukprot:TRINITY_DN10065_c0_g1_i1.p1 TRINITY_DN10065_c0_g1~~TRINITY_DN10065_c0_g1_i1.p1  ORF type:complete len:587 (+),score=84.34 TRINITY_DN10065_c0_g1_i1:138-1898(+)
MIKNVLETLTAGKIATVVNPLPLDGYLSVSGLTEYGVAMSVVGPYLVAGLNSEGKASIVVGQKMEIKRNEAKKITNITMTKVASMSDKQKDALLLCVDSLIASVSPPIDSRHVSVEWVADTLAVIKVEPSIKTINYSLSGVEWKFNDNGELQHNVSSSPFSHELPPVLRTHFTKELRRVLKGKHSLVFPLNIVAARVTTEGWLSGLPNQFYLSTSDHKIVGRLLFTAPDSGYQTFTKSVVVDPLDDGVENYEFPTSYLEPTYFIKPVLVYISAESIRNLPVSDSAKTGRGNPELHGCTFEKVVEGCGHKKESDTKTQNDTSKSTVCVSASQLASILQSGLDTQDAVKFVAESGSLVHKLQVALTSVRTPKKLKTNKFPHTFTSIPLTPDRQGEQFFTSLHENETIEFKPTSFLNKNIRKTINSFINSKGGSLFIGIRDNGCIEGTQMSVSDKEKFIRDCNECCAALRPMVAPSALQVVFHLHPADAIQQSGIKDWWKKKPSNQPQVTRFIPEIRVAPQPQWPFYFMGPKSPMVRMRRLASSDIMPDSIMVQRLSDWLTSQQNSGGLEVKVKNKKPPSPKEVKRSKT